LAVAATHVQDMYMILVVVVFAVVVCVMRVLCIIQVLAADLQKNYMRVLPDLLRVLLWVPQKELHHSAFPLWEQ
jgi:hypothetical protein